MLKYMGPILAVSDIAPARYFYETLLGQSVKYDFGVNVTFEGDFSVHLRSHLHSLMGAKAADALSGKTHAAELTFETDEIDALRERLLAAGVEPLHDIQEQPWGQRVLRVYDPDGHVLEIGEVMTAVVRRMFGEGLAVDAIVARTGMPLGFVEGALRPTSET